MPIGTPQNPQKLGWSDLSGTISAYAVPSSLANRILIVAVSVRTNSSSNNVSSITFGGVGLTEATDVNNGGTVRTTIWYLLNPDDSVAADIVINLTTNIQATATAFVVDGVDQTTPFRVTTGGNQEDSVASGSVLVPDSDTTDLIIAQLVVASSTGASLVSAFGESQNLLTTPQTASSQTSFVTYVAGASPDKTLTATFDIARSYSWSAISLVAATSGTQYDQDVSGSITPTGTLTTEVIEPTGFSQSVEGSITPTGEITSFGLGLDTLAGSITPTGTLATQRSATTRTQTVSGSITPTGDLLTRISGLQLGGSITPTGELTLDPVQIFMQSVAGGITPTGTLSTLVDAAPTFGSTGSRLIRRNRRIIIDGE